MKVFLRFIGWALLSIVIQSLGLLFIQKVYFKPSSEIEVTEVANVVKSKDLNIVIPTDAKQIECSFDAKYISYHKQNKLMIIDTDTSQTKEIVTNDGTEVLYNNWVAKNNIIMLAEKKTDSSGEAKVYIKTYNVRTDVESDIYEEKLENGVHKPKAVCTYEDGIKVDNIVSSLTTGVTYAAISRDGLNSQLYRFDTNAAMTKLDKRVPELGGIKAYQHTDVLIYEDSLNKVFNKYTNGKITKLNFDTLGDLEMLGVDNKNMLFMGSISGGKITKIISGEYGTEPSTWVNSIELKKPTESKNIFINSKSEILVNDCLTGKVTNMSLNKTVSYEGKVISITDKLICSMSEGKVYLKGLTDYDPDVATETGTKAE